MYLAAAAAAAALSALPDERRGARYVGLLAQWELQEPRGLQLRLGVYQSIAVKAFANKQRAWHGDGLSAALGRAGLMPVRCPSAPAAAC